MSFRLGPNGIEEIKDSDSTDDSESEETPTEEQKGNSSSSSSKNMNMLSGSLSNSYSVSNSYASSSSSSSSGGSGGGSSSGRTSSSRSSSSSSSSSSNSSTVNLAPEIESSDTNNLESCSKTRKIPLANQVDLPGHSKAVACVSIEPSGNRLVTGSMDYSIKMYDFGGMDSRHRHFKSIEVVENYPVTSVSHSPSGDKMVVSTGSSAPKVFDREGAEIITFVKGDMYIRDLSNTKGHLMEVTCVQWHPTDKNTIISSSIDGSVRVWDLLGDATFGKLCNKHVLKIRGVTGTNRVGAMSCCYAPNGLKIIGGASDGTVHIWNHKKVYSKADVILRLNSFAVGGGTVNAKASSVNMAFNNTSSTPVNVTSVTMSGDNKTLAARYDDGRIALWDVTKPKNAPLKTIWDMHNAYPTANAEFSPDGSLLLCGTTAAKQATGTGTDNKSSSSVAAAVGSMGPPVPKNNQAGDKPRSDKSRLYFYEVSGDSVQPVMHIAIVANASVTMVKWQAATNQIYCCVSTGFVRVLYDPLMSKKGALLSSSKAPKREKDPTDFALMGEIHNPLALPMYRKEMNAEGKREKGKRKSVDLKDPVKAKIPQKPATQGPGVKENNSFFYTNYVMSFKKGVDLTVKDDPRAALLKMDKLTREDPMFFNKAYSETQPSDAKGAQLHELTFEEEQMEFKKKQKKF